MNIAPSLRANPSLRSALARLTCSKMACSGASPPGWSRRTQAHVSFRYQSRLRWSFSQLECACLAAPTR